MSSFVKHTFHSIRCCLGVLWAAGMLLPTIAYAQNDTVAISQLQGIMARQIELDRARTDTESYIAEIVNKWTYYAGEKSFSDSWGDELARALGRLPAERLVEAMSATSYSQIINVISGRPKDEPLLEIRSDEFDENSGSPLTAAGLGDAGSDLVYFPVTPCRIVDTRSASAGPIAANSARSFATNIDLASQGGRAAGCGIPTDPAAIAVTITVVSAGSGGNLRAYPYGGALPGASVLNYATGQTLANTTIIPICQICGYDFNIRADYATVHVLVDIVGYFWSPISNGLPGIKMEKTVTVLPGQAFDVYSEPCAVDSSATGGGYDYDTASTNVWVWQSDVDYLYGDRWRCRGMNNSIFTINFKCQVMCLSTPGR